ncbi:F0F1 ATP synthase subunit B [Pelosinus propionicus]|uniref:ATP synthase subunit b n=1 Tax=Pelosinus propionicus DSM 13327 TaxID=1123291 RepID=A0A1I4J7W1_9FIRM|nr:F0F1 ATP synthase subunit B [Pelosinus propionicus]SFL62649.1 F-type H+-transporting ATPase subunit b [Pelosinus propionicus DSM 13327]
MVELNGTLLAQIVNFLLLVAILAKFAYKPLMQGLADRQQKIADAIDTAERERREAEQLKLEYKQYLVEARAKAQSIVETAEKLAEENKEEILKSARAESAHILQKAQEEVIRERELALSQLRSEVVALSMAAATKIVKEKMDTELNASIVSDFIEKLDDEKIGGLPC